MAHPDRLADRLVNVHDLRLETQPAPGDPRYVEQVVDQPRLDFDVAADHLQGRSRSRRSCSCPASR